MSKNGGWELDVRLLLCGRIQRLRRWSHVDLSAPYWRLYWCRNRGALVIYAGRETPLGPDRFVLIPPNTPFAARQTRPVGHLYLHFLVRPPYALVKPHVFSFPAPPPLRETAIKLFHVPPATPLSPADSVLALLLVHYGLSRLPTAELPPPPADPRLAVTLRRLDDSAAPVPNAELARLAHMSTNAFIRMFKQAVGVSPQTYGRRRRVERACVLLHFSAASIEEIAARTGFCDRYHFSRVFKKLRGLGPAEYRRRRETISPAENRPPTTLRPGEKLRR